VEGKYWYLDPTTTETDDKDRGLFFRCKACNKGFASPGGANFHYARAHYQEWAGGKAGAGQAGANQTPPAGQAAAATSNPPSHQQAPGGQAASGGQAGDTDDRRGRADQGFMAGQFQRSKTTCEKCGGQLRLLDRNNARMLQFMRRGYTKYCPKCMEVY
jgi:uncharacterized protein (DUF983 family)